MIEKYRQPNAFSMICCDECQRKDDLTQNKYTDAILCNDCLNDLVAEIKALELEQEE